MESLSLFKLDSKGREVVAPATSQMHCALNAIACISIHDAAEEDEESPQRTLKEITGSNHCLNNTNNICLRYMVCAFGRHSIPVFMRILKEEYHLTDEAIAEMVDESIKEMTLGE